MTFELFLPLDLLRRRFRGRKLKAPDEAQIDLDLLHPVAVHLLRRVDDDLFNEFVDHRRGQLGEIRVLLRQGKELFRTGRIFLKRGQVRFGLVYGSVQLLLFRLIVRQQAVKAFGADPANGKGFVELFDDPVQLVPALAVLVQLSLRFFSGVLLPDL